MVGFPRMAARNRGWGWTSLFLAVLAGLVLACGDDGTGPKEARIGAAGGSASLADGAISLTVPPGALSDFVSFTASATASGPATGLIVPGSQYQLGPGGTTFGRLVTMILTYDPSLLPAGVRETELRLYRAEGQQWVVTANSSPNPDQNSVTGLVDRLGVFAAVGLPVTSVDLHPAFYTLAAGQTHQFAAFGRGPGNEALSERPVAWESSDTGVVTVDGGGLVTGVGIGTAEIHALVESRQATATVRVSDCAAQTSIPETECHAILDVYGGITKGDWQLTRAWVNGPDPCDWRGVTCEGGVVTELSIRATGGGGTIPHTISDLSELRLLDLSGNQLTGVIPKNIGELQDLESLDLRSNELSGSLPVELGNLQSLKSMRLSSNSFSGEIPAAIGSLSSLDSLMLGNNELSGTIPFEIGSLSSLEHLSLIGNQLTGVIPSELGNLSNLEYLSLSANQLSGTIPSSLGGLGPLKILGLSRNQLTGPIPASLGNLSNLELFSLWENQLSGVVPIEVAILGGLIQQNHSSSDCRWVPPGNDGLSLPDTQPFHDADLDGDGKICGLTIGGD